MIILYKGARGRGKTLSMVKDGFIYFKQGYRILRNFFCTFGDYISNEEVLELDKESNLSDCVLMIDEIQIFFDSRRAMANQNLHFSNFIQQIRKRNIILLITTQYSNTIDSRLRQHLDIIAFPNFIKQFNVCVVRYMDLTRLQDDDILQSSPIQANTPLIREIVFDAIPVYKLYNTSEMIV